MTFSSDPQNPTPIHVLVLGARGVADLIAEQLSSGGFRPVLQYRSGVKLPKPSDPDSFAKLSEIFRDFVKNSPVRPGFAHYVHPGVSAWAERSELPALAQEEGLAVVAPSPWVLNLFGNKLSLFEEASRYGIPHLLIGQDLFHSAREIDQFIRGSGALGEARKLPLVLRSAKGGGSFGTYVIHDAREVETRLPLWLEQLRKNAGEVILFAERYLGEARKVVVPFARSVQGEIEIFPFVDVSLQSRHRKIVEFCPVRGVAPTVERQIAAWTRAFATGCGYVGVGTLEFLVDDQRAFLSGGSARLNTGFHLWEKVAGTPAVLWQMNSLRRGWEGGWPARQSDPRWSSGIALRVHSEDPVLQLPQPGLVRELMEKTRWDLSTAEARLHLCVEPGGRIDAEDYGLVGLLWVGGQDFQHALTMCRGVLEEFWIAGSLQTNERFLSELVSHPWVREGMFHAGFVDEEFIPALRPPTEWVPVFSAVVNTLPELEGQVRHAVGDQWVKLDPSVVQWVEGPEFWRSEDGRPGLSGALRMPEGETRRVCAYPISDNKWQVRIGLWVLPVRRVLATGTARGKPRPKVSSLVTGRVHSILYREGAVVPAHECLLIVESQGVLVPHALPVEVQVQKWLVSAEQKVTAGQELATI